MNNNVAEAERVIADLDAKRADWVRRGTELQDERSNVALAAHTGDEKARKRLDALNAEIARHSSELESIDAALKVATQNRDRARHDESRAADRSRALALRAALAEFARHAQSLDDAFAVIAAEGAALLETQVKMRQLGSVAPSQEQLTSLGRRSLLTALASTPWHRDFELVEPRLRRRFAELVAVWISSNERQIAERLKEEEAA